MNTHKQTLVIFLAFANDTEDASRRLGGLEIEKDHIKKALNLAQIAGLCEVIVEAGATIDSIMDTFQNPLYRDRISIFHYAGHADGYQLLLQDRYKGNQVAKGEGLVSFFSKQKSLQLIFLNGCSTQEQAEELISAGVPVVIGTSRSIVDTVAVKLASRFYQALGNNYSIERAWEEAQDEFKIRGNIEGLTRDLVGLGSTGHQSQKDQFPWKIYYRQDKENRAKAWNLGEEGQNPLFGLPLPDKYYQTLPPAPFPGLHYFKEGDTALFFGRGVQIRALYQKLSGPHPVILFYGKSGVGKSSLLFAGLKPRIQDRYAVVYIRRDQEKGLSGSLETALDDIFQVPKPKEQERPTEQEPETNSWHDQNRLEAAILNLDQAYSQLKETNIEHRLQEIIKHLRLLLPDSKSKINDVIGKWQAIETIVGKPLLVILDQVEEVYTRPMPLSKGGDAEIIDLLERISPLYEENGSNIKGRLMLSFRKEYFPEIQALFEEAMLSFDYLFLQRLNKKGIIEAVTGVESNETLRQKYNQLQVEKSSEANGNMGLAERIANDLTSDPESPIAPILQIIMRKLWDLEIAQDDPDFLLSVSEYNSLENTVGAFFQEQIEKLTTQTNLQEAEQSGLVLDILNQHTTAKGTAGSVRLEVLYMRYPNREPLAKEIVDELEKLSLLVVIDRDPYTTLLAHDVLAPVVMQAYNNSEYPGQRAAQVLQSKMRNVWFKLSAKSFETLEEQGLPPEILNGLKTALLDIRIRGNDQFLSKVAEQLQQLKGTLQKKKEKKLEDLPWDEYPELLLSTSEATIGANQFKEVIEKIILNEEEIRVVNQGRNGMRKLNYHEEVLVETSQKILNEQQEKLREAHRQVVNLKLKEIDQSINNRDYEIALEKCETVFFYGTNQDKSVLEEKIPQRMQAIAFFFLETGQIDMARKALLAIQRLTEQMSKPKFWNFSETELKERLHPNKESLTDQFRLLIKLVDQEQYPLLWLKFIDQAIMYLEFSSAWKSCSTAVALQSSEKQAEVGPGLLKRLQELAFFFLESGNFFLAVSSLNLTRQFEKAKKSSKFWSFSEEEWAQVNETQKKTVHQKLTKCIQSINKDYFQELWDRYYPKLLPVPGGTFQMGNKAELDGPPEWKVAQPGIPIHPVTLNDFRIGKTPMTNWQIKLFIKATKRKKGNPIVGQQGNHPASGFSWFDAIAYCNWLSQRMGLEPVYQIEDMPLDANDLESQIEDWTAIPNWKANGFRLATEAEWEYAARGGQLSKDYIYSGGNQPNEVCWYSQNSKRSTHPVGLKKSNELGLYDMSGLMFEWCWDWQGDYEEGPAENPTGAKTGIKRVFRGGSFNGEVYQMQAARRDGGEPFSRNRRFGFRIAQNVDLLNC